MILATAVAEAVNPASRAMYNTPKQLECCEQYTLPCKGRKVALETLCMLCVCFCASKDLSFVVWPILAIKSLKCHNLYLIQEIKRVGEKAKEILSNQGGQATCLG